MTLVSYAQNHEDIILWRALRCIESGFYIDVGANDPTNDSVTRLFYDRGWSGINVEPSAEYFARLVAERERDINLCCAAGSQNGTTTFYEAATRGWSTSDPSVGEQYVGKGQARTVQVEQLKLDTILERHGHPQIHFLKIDVEGAEAAVLEGLSLERYRPWIVVVEALDPVTQGLRSSEWEPRLMSAGYSLVFFDGLNRFYLADEHAELTGAFASPPNVLDGFRTSAEVELESRLHDTRAAGDRSAAELESSLRANQDLMRSLEELRGEYSAVLASSSWRLTKPLRILNAARKSTGTALRGRMKTAARDLVGLAAAQGDRFPRAKRAAVEALHRFPAVEYRLRTALSSHRSQRSAAPVLVGQLADHDQRPTSRDDEVALPQPKGRRVLYIYVEHTANCPTNTGVQRVARSMAKGLVAQGECVRYVKWHAESQRCLLINAAEREHLARWNGPDVTEEERTLYLPPDQPHAPVAGALPGENHWLLVPEVTHITFQQSPVTLDLLLWARRAGLRSGFVFYDAIPLRRPELDAMAPRHALYMQQLLLADVVWPISEWARADLQAFWLQYERAGATSMPEVRTQALSGESSLNGRVVRPQPGEQLILSIGSIEPRKNQVQLIRAFEAYCTKHPGTPWRLVLVGNLHPSVAEDVRRSTQSGSFVKHLGHVSDEELDRLYRTCSFTVFPSLEEGFGLPILESLWYGRPCICADFGSMAEVAREGGCLTVDTGDIGALEGGITRMIEDASLRDQLAAEAVGRPIRTWTDYAASLSKEIEAHGHPARRLGTIYFWIDATLEFSKNTGIQRVTRQLARALLQVGAQLVPVKWDRDAGTFGPVSGEALAFFARWNGPDPAAWRPWIEPARTGAGAWFLMPELPLNHPVEERALLLKSARAAGLRCAAVFYDAIPWKMRRIYPAPFAQAHRAYMLELNEYDLVLPISAFSKDDLVDFLGAELPRPQSLSDKIKAVGLAGEFAESTRARQGPQPHDGPLRILCVGTVEPRKNHETLLRAFEIAREQTDVAIKLTIAGGSHSIEPALGDRVRSFVAAHPDVQWEEDADDARLRELHLSSDFTVYPSVEEGFGLPILESLWYGRPCVCADFGAMLEVAAGGGCLTVDVRDPEILAQALVRMVTEPQLREQLAQQALSRSFKTWSHYATEVAIRMADATPSQVPSESTFAPEESVARMLAMRLKPRPKLSVCISTYNRAEWLSASLRNWARMYPQPLQGVELLVCDNTSTDHTPDVVAPYLSRPDFSYHRNPENVGMLGNLRETAHHAAGEYVWILGDDDLLLPGSIEQVMQALHSHPGIALVYLNYAFTREDDARKVKDFDSFFAEAQPIVPAEPDRFGPIRTICARNENFFTAIYTLVFRRDHAIRAYSQDTSGRPFSSMGTCIPTTKYVLGHMMDEPGQWIGSPQLVVNLNVSWMKYAPLWILERVPEVYEIAERRGVPAADVDRWRRHTLPGVVHYFQDIYQDDPLGNAQYFSPERLVRRFKHLPEFTKVLPVLKDAYARAHANGHPAARRPPSKVFPDPGTS